jgi:hypothetical protein
MKLVLALLFASILFATATKDIFDHISQEEYDFLKNNLSEKDFEQFLSNLGNQEITISHSTTQFSQEITSSTSYSHNIFEHITREEYEVLKNTLSEENFQEFLSNLGNDDITGNQLPILISPNPISSSSSTECIEDVLERIRQLEAENAALNE